MFISVAQAAETAAEILAPSVTSSRSTNTPSSPANKSEGERIVATTFHPFS